MDGSMQSDQKIYRLITGIHEATLELPGRDMTIECHALLLTMRWDKHLKGYISRIQWFHEKGKEEALVTLPLQCWPLEYDVRAMDSNEASVVVSEQKPQGDCHRMILIFRDGTVVHVLTSPDHGAPKTCDLADEDELYDRLTRRKRRR